MTVGEGPEILAVWAIHDLDICSYALNGSEESVRPRLDRSNHFIPGPEPPAATKMGDPLVSVPLVRLTVHADYLNIRHSNPSVPGWVNKVAKATLQRRVQKIRRRVNGQAFIIRLRLLALCLPARLGPVRGWRGRFESADEEFIPRIVGLAKFILPSRSSGLYQWGSKAR